MDIDPPPPQPQPSSGPTSQKKKFSTKTVKKPKFTPKPPSRRKLVLPKSDSDDDEDARLAAQELLHKANERVGKRGTKLTKKSSSNVASSQGAESSSKKNDQVKDEKNSSNVPNISEKRVTRSSSITAKNEVTENMLIDDESGSSSKSEHEYKEPWDYERSYYPVTLPLRQPCSVNPEVLDAQEFGKEEEYDETKLNAASELGLKEPNADKQRILFQFPEILPLSKQTHQVPISSKGKEKVESLSSLKGDASSKGIGLKDLPNGYMGKLLVYKSGAVKLKLGDTLFDVSPGILGKCKQDVVMMNTKDKQCCVLGSVDKKAVVTPDVDSILENIKQL